MATRDAPYRTRRWTRSEYARLIALGVLREDDPIELLAGRLVVAGPQNTPHAIAIELAAAVLRTAFGPGWRIRVQLPLALDRRSAPEPDVAVVAGNPRDAATDHPSHPALVLEVAESTLRLDRGLKLRLYAHAGVPDYWIVNLADRVLEVHREPSGGLAGPRAMYRSVTRLAPADIVAPLACSHQPIAVAELLP